MTLFSSITKHSRTALHQRYGQSLVEFILVMPILVLILIGGFSFGLGIHDAHMASDAVQLPALQKLELANQANGVNSADLLKLMNNTSLSGSLKSGQLIDNVSIQQNGPYISIMVGSKRFSPPASFVPGFTIRVGQVINRNLLEDAYVGTSNIRSYTSPWIPGGTPVEPPWLNPPTDTTTPSGPPPPPNIILPP